jgi:hypothetical protein
MDDHQKQNDERAEARRVEERERTITNIVLLLILVALVGIGVWLSNAMIDARRADECISAGLRFESWLRPPNKSMTYGIGGPPLKVPG